MNDGLRHYKTIYHVHLHTHSSNQRLLTAWDESLVWKWRCRAPGRVGFCREKLVLHPLWCCYVECVIHHERDVHEEQQYICVARTSNNKRDCDAWSLLLRAATVWSFAHMPLGFPIATLEKKIFTNMISKFFTVIFPYTIIIPYHFLHGHRLFHLDKPDPDPVDTETIFNPI